jgi:hypothetical protein
MPADASDDGKEPIVEEPSEEQIALVAELRADCWDPGDDRR